MKNKTMSLGVAAALLAGGAREFGEVVEIRPRPDCGVPMHSAIGTPRKKNGKRKRRHRGVGW